jgi:outer membrane protein insertion porin family
MKNLKPFFLFSSVIVFTCVPFTKTFPIQNSSTTSHNQVYENATVEKIDIHWENRNNGDSFDASLIQNKLNTKVGSPFSEKLFDADLKTLASEYGRIEPTIKLVGDGVQITIKIWTAPKINTITWEGNSNISTTKLKKTLKTESGSAFQRDAFNKSLTSVKELYIKKGFFESEISYTTTMIENNNGIDITIHVHEGRPGRIERILFNGFTSQEQTSILAKIHTHPFKVLYSLIMGDGYIQEDLLEQDRLTIIQLLQNEGFIDAKIDIQITEAQKAGRVVITITADRGALFHYGTVTFEGNTFFSDEQIEKAFLAHPGETYSPDALQKTVEAIKNLYGRKGYIDARVYYEAQLSIDEPIYNVHFQIEERDTYKIGLIHILGNENTKTHVILRESLLTPGEIFDNARLKATQQRLQNIGYFKDVNVYAIRSQDDLLLGENYRDIYIEVSEQPTGHAGLSFGQGGSSKLFGGFDIIEKNFNFKGVARLSKDGISALRGNGEYLHASIQFGASDRHLGLSWVTPYCFDTNWRVGVDTFYDSMKNLPIIKKDDDKKEKDSLPKKILHVTSYGASLFASYPISIYWTQALRQRLKHETDKAKKDDSIPNKQPLNNITPFNSKTFIISATSASITYDSVDNIAKPHNGFRSILELECAAPPGTVYFLKYSYLNVLYHQLSRHGVLKYKWDVRFIQPIMGTQFEDIPYKERSFLGGEGTVRGYKYRALGPEYPSIRKSDNAATTPPKELDFNLDLQGQPKGGLSWGVISIEYMHELAPMLDCFIFTDIGTISDKKFTIDLIKASVGCGIRLNFFNQIPITVSYGIPITKTEEALISRWDWFAGIQF